MSTQILYVNLNPERVYECNFKIGKTYFSSAVQFYTFHFILIVLLFGDTWIAIREVHFQLMKSEFLDD
jgi:hypothetical protein